MNNNITKLLGFKEVIVKKVTEERERILVYVEMPVKINVCPCCQKETNRIHDYTKREIKISPIRNKSTALVYKQRRYACACGKKFIERNEIITKHRRISKEVVYGVIKDLRDRNHTYKSVGKKYDISTTSAQRIFDQIEYPHVPINARVLSIDEFKGNAGKSKYQAMLCDPENKRILDVYGNRHKYELAKSLREQKVEHRKVEYFITDMWDPYIELAQAIFYKAKICIDRFHYTRVMANALDGVRIRVQKGLGEDYRKYFKHSKKILLKREEEIKKEKSKEILEELVGVSNELKIAHDLLQKFYQFNDSKDVVEARERLRELYEEIEKSGIEEMLEAVKTIQRYEKYILNSFLIEYTNGFIEGKNNVIKVLKRVSFGVRNMERFRNRILHCCNG